MLPRHKLLNMSYLGLSPDRKRHGSFLVFTFLAEAL